MSRNRLVALVAVFASLALAGTALAAKVTGGSTTLTLSDAATKVLSANHLTVAPLVPATASGATLSFPIVRGRLNPHNHGYLIHSGGFSISNGAKTVRLRHLTIYSGRSGVSLFALLPGHARRYCVRAQARHTPRCRLVIYYRVARVGQITGVTVSNGTATGTVRLTKISAAAINELAGKSVAAAGQPIGTVSVMPTIG